MPQNLFPVEHCQSGIAGRRRISGNVNGPGALAVAHPLPYSRKLAAQIIRNEANSAAMISIRAELGT
jgi:hypothetical protein